MSPRSIRRAAERKQRKLERKQQRLAAAQPIPAPTPDSLEHEFSPELIAEAQALRERIATRNRANAAHSTGPVSPEGKLASSRNALKHGLASGELIIPGEDPAAFDSLLETLLAEHQPASPTEHLLVRQMAQSHWLEQRALRLQNDCFTPNGIDEKRLALFLRYQTTHQRAFYKALNTLLKLKRSRGGEGAVPTSGFVSQDPELATSISVPGFVSQSSPELQFSPVPATSGTASTCAANPL